MIYVIVAIVIVSIITFVFCKVAKVTTNAEIKFNEDN
jgi:septation ring formation regulator EzrA